MKITKHKLVAESGDVDISFDKTPNVSGEFLSGYPDTIIIHYTAGASLDSSVSWLKNPAAKASAHLVVGKKGKIVQLVPFNTKSWHAGASEWKGRKWLNNFSIGIEIDNAGLLEKRLDGYYTNFGKKINNDQVLLASHKHQNEVKGWETFTEEQLISVEEICIELISTYAIKEILGHDDVAPDRKVDPGPAFPMQSLKEKILIGRNDEAVVDTLSENKVGIVAADFLNIRTRPSIQAMKASQPLSKGTKVILQETKGDWSRVKVDIDGWVSNKWLSLLEDD